MHLFSPRPDLLSAITGPVYALLAAASSFCTSARHNLVSLFGFQLRSSPQTDSQRPAVILTVASASVTKISTHSCDRCRSGTLLLRYGTLHPRSGNLHPRFGTLHPRSGTLQASCGTFNAMIVCILAICKYTVHPANHVSEINLILGF